MEVDPTVDPQDPNKDGQYTNGDIVATKGMTGTAEADAWIGRLVGDRQRYHLEQCLGIGGMGNVYLAMDTVLGKQVALKLLKASLIDQKDLRKRFEREVSISAALNDDHIVQVSDYGVSEEGHPFYVMEYLRGQTLSQLLSAQRRLPVERAIKLMTQICAGLRVAHEGVSLWRAGTPAAERIQVVHRDLKPENIFLVPHELLGERVKILDFGIAKIRNDQMTQTNLTTGLFLGTCRYAGPEQWEADENIDGRADIYSLGIILYEMLSGTDPFGLSQDPRGSRATSWMSAHALTPPRPLRSVSGCQQLPPALEQIVARCLQKSPLDRYATVDELSKALQSVLDQRVAAAPTQSGEDVTQAMPLIRQPAKPAQPDPPQPQQAETLPRQNRSTLASASDPTLSPQTQPRLGSVTRTQALSSVSTRPKQTIGLVAGVGLILSGVGLFWFLARPTLLSQARTAAQQADLDTAITLATQIQPRDNDYANAQSLLAEWRFKQVTDHLAKQEFTTARTLLAQIPADQPMASQAQRLMRDLDQLQVAQAQAKAGQIREALAIVTKMDPKETFGAMAQDLICTDVQTLLNQQFQAKLYQQFSALAATSKSGNLPPIFTNYHLQGCSSAQLELNSEIVSLANRDDENLKVIGIAMAGILWNQFLPPSLQQRLETGKLQVTLSEKNQPTVEILITQPALLNQEAQSFDKILTSSQLKKL